MKALILNSGLGRRMGALTEKAPKCMTQIAGGETIISRQIRQLKNCGVNDIVVTTGPFADILERHILSVGGDMNVSFVNNAVYDKTNYIYSIFLAKDLLRDDIILLHGDLVFDETVLRDMLQCDTSRIAVSSAVPLPEKDFKAVISSDRVVKVGIEFFDNALAAQPLYCLKKKDWLVWLAAIEQYVEDGKVTCYAENALNTVSHSCEIYIYDTCLRLCSEIDTPEDLEKNNAMIEKERE